MPHDLQASLAAYRPYNEQEQRDLPLLLAALKQPDSFTRQNETAHFTASAWVVNPARDKVLMIYHNIYNSWSWTGGHADGETDLLAVALREVSEETGASSATISRVNRCLNYGIGYRKTLDNLKKESIANEDGSDLEK